MSFKVTILLTLFSLSLAFSVFFGKVYVTEDSEKTQKCYSVGIDFIDMKNTIDDVEGLFKSELKEESYDIRESLKSRAMLWLGTKYKYGGETNDGIDCSAFIQNVYSEFYNIPRTSSAQCRSLTTKVSKEDLEVGDLVFMNASGSVDHVAMIYGINSANEPLIIHASSNRGIVTIEKLHKYNRIIHSFKTIIPDNICKKGV